MIGLEIGLLGVLLGITIELFAIVYVLERIAAALEGKR